MFRVSYKFILLLLLFFSCTATKEIKDGEAAFNYKQYDKAYTLLQKEYKKAESAEIKGRKAFLAAESLRRQGKYEAAINWYAEAIDNNYGEVARFYHAYMLKTTENYSQAFEEFSSLNQDYPNDLRYKQELLSIKNAQSALAQYDESLITLTNLGLNTSDNDFHPLWLNHEEFTFVSDRNSSQGSNLYEWTGKKYADLYVYKTTDASITPFETGHNSEYFEGNIAVSKNNDTRIYTLCMPLDAESNSYCRLYESSSFGIYREGRMLDFIEDGYNYMHPTISDDGKILIFSAELPGGVGNYDLWVSVKKDNDTWSQPSLLSDRINSPGDERFPYLAGDTLYFASNYINGMGGLDIFFSYLMEDKTWSPPHNIGPPINGGYDDFAFIPDYQKMNDSKIELSGYFSSNRSGGAGGDDIYHIVKEYADDKIQNQEKPEQIVTLELRIIDSESEDMIENVAIDMNFNETDSSIIAVDGKAEFKIQQGHSYSMIFKKDGYFTKSLTINKGELIPLQDREKTQYVRTIKLSPIKIGEEIVLEDIYYDYDEYYIRNDAKPRLDSLVILLNLNPEINIILGSHTDCRGEPDYNKELAQKRAEAAVNYLQEKGISKTRLQATGYGEDRPLIECECSTCTEEQHQQNRRTTFKIVD